MSGGAHIDSSKQLAMRNERDENVRKLKKALSDIEKLGALVKDLDIGLLDFMARYKGRDVCLCWKLGEAGIAHWHGAEEGFRGRKPIDGDFEANHSGEATSDGDAPN
jgi:hypothetical protein